MLIEDTKIEVVETPAQSLDPVPNFPAEFKKLDFWAVYGKGKKFKANGDRDKEPCDPRTGRLANTVEGRSDFATAARVMTEYHGLGFGPLPYEAGYSFIDFDDCVDPVTRVIDPRIAPIIKEVGGYWEYSPSGTGVHGFGKWQAADQKGHKVGRAEIYPSGRYFTVTGNQISGTTNVIEGQDLTRLYARIVSGEFVSEAEKGKVSSTATSLNLKARVGIGFHDSTITRYAGWLREKGFNAEEMEPRIIRYVEEQFDGYGSDYLEMISKCIKSVCHYPAGDPTPTVLIDNKLPGEVTVYQRAQESAAKQAPTSSIDIIPAGTKFKNPTKVKASLAEYPLWVWEGTLFNDFSELCGEGNFIAKEYFVEALKTVVGAVAGHRIQAEKSRGQQPSRFYSVLIGPGGCGKSTAVTWALEAFIGTGLIYDLSQEETAYTNIGCARANFGSDVGMKKGFALHDRIIQVYDEVTNLIAKFSVQGSGDSFLDVTNQLFEYCPVYPTMNTKEDKVIKMSGRESHNTILGCTTPLKWRNAFMKTGIEGSGLHQRLNIISNFSKKRVPELDPPDFREFMDRLVRKIQPLEYQKVSVVKTAEATEMLNTWWSQKDQSEHWQTLPDDIKGRINVLVQRNVALISWLMGGDHIPNPEKSDVPIEVICDEDIMRRAIALAETEIGARILHQPPRGDNDYAIMENSIKLFFAENGGEPAQRGVLFRALHADRLGTQIFSKCVDNLVAEGILRLGLKEGEKRRGRKAQIIFWIGDEEPPDEV